MPIPKYDEITKPLLKWLADGEQKKTSDAIEYISSHFSLNDDERKRLLSSGKQTVISNRVGWARTYLKMSGLVNYVKRGVLQITSRGKEVLKENPDKIDQKYLVKFDEFLTFKDKANKNTSNIESKAEDETPEDLLESAYNEIRNNLAVEILDNVRKASPSFFENLVVELLINMGYGGSRKDAGEAIGRSGDEGIDGIIKEDRLGLDVIYIQAKRWNDKATIGRPEIQKFVGALAGKQARKGIFIATTSYTQEAIQYAKTVDHKVILIDGDQLSQLMIDYNVGVAQVASYEIKKIDLDYFEE